MHQDRETKTIHWRFCEASINARRWTRATRCIIGDNLRGVRWGLHVLIRHCVSDGGCTLAPPGVYDWMNDPCTAAMRICTIRSLRPFVYCKYKVGAGVVFTAGWVFIVFDTAVTVRARLADDGQFRSLRWFEWIRPLVAVLSFVAWLLCILSRLLAAAGEREIYSPQSK